MVNQSHESDYKHITYAMHYVGICPNLKGHNYIRDVIIMMKNRPELRYQNVQDIYEIVATEYGITRGSVERAIRTSIEKAWLVCDPDVLFDVFGNTINPQRGRPTNTEFLMMMLDYVEG